MRSLVTVALTVMLTACGAYGEPIFLARMYDANDPCQVKNNNYKFPEWCGAGSRGRTTVYATPTGSPIGAPVGYTKN